MAEQTPDIKETTSEYKVDGHSQDNHHDGEGRDARALIADYITHTPKDKISEVTPLSLDQHRPHSLIGMLSDVLRDMCLKAVARQGKWNKIYAEYHKDKEGHSIIPVNLEADPAWDVTKLADTKLERWSYLYKQLRRGYKNELLMSLTTLAQVQLESEPQENPEDIWKRIVKDGN